MSNVSPLDVLINRACNPTMGEPNYALHLEVAEYINQKKANTYVVQAPLRIPSMNSRSAAPGKARWPSRDS